MVEANKKATLILIATLILATILLGLLIYITATFNMRNITTLDMKAVIGVFIIILSLVLLAQLSGGNLRNKKLW